VPAAALYCAVADKLVSASGNRITVSPGSPRRRRRWATGRRTPTTVNDYHDLPAGANVVALEALSNRVLAFTTQGVYVISNLGVAIVDTAGNPQRSVQLVHPDLEAWGPNGITAWGGGLVVAATDGVWLVDGVSSPAAAVPVDPAVLPGVRADRLPAGADGGLPRPSVPADLRREQRDAGDARGASRPAGERARRDDLPVVAVHGARRRRAGARDAADEHVHAGAARRRPRHGRARGEAGRLLRADRVAEERCGRHDAQFTLETRDYRTGDGRNRNLVRRVQLRYELIDGGTDDPTIQAFASAGKQATIAGMAWDSGVWDTGTWGEDTVAAFTQLAFSAPEDDGTDPFVWDVARHTEYVRYRFICAAPAASLIVRSVTSFIRQSGKPF
jgi:hypothetical protein